MSSRRGFLQVENVSKNEINVSFRIKPPITNEELNSLFVNAWESHRSRDFSPVLDRGLTYVGAYDGTQLIGFVNVAWDGGVQHLYWIQLLTTGIKAAELGSV